mmetsp:Transcript_7584/g.31397  ORF Transcript_7584/g.31397 Transcript_7584/m.31397 type:complete len:239 (-) Transcript_7584:563-1279(-)
MMGARRLRSTRCRRLLEHHAPGHGRKRRSARATHHDPVSRRSGHAAARMTMGMATEAVTREPTATPHLTWFMRCHRLSLRACFLKASVASESASDLDSSASRRSPRSRIISTLRSMMARTSSTWLATLSSAAREFAASISRSRTPRRSAAPAGPSRLAFLGFLLVHDTASGRRLLLLLRLAASDGALVVVVVPPGCWDEVADTDEAPVAAAASTRCASTMGPSMSARRSQRDWALAMG